MMQAFHNDLAIKAKYLDRVAAHREADELTKGTGWYNGKGCAIGCTLESYDHSRYPVELGIPEMLARLEDCIFEGLPNGDSQAWPERFLSAVPVGADLSLVGWKFLHWLLTDSLVGAYDHELVRDAVQQCAAVIEPMTHGQKADTSAAWMARTATRSAARTAAGDARSAAKSAWNAAYAAAHSEWSAEWSAVYAARAAEDAAESTAWIKMADKLIELIEAAPPGLPSTKGVVPLTGAEPVPRPHEFDPTGRAPQSGKKPARCCPGRPPGHTGECSAVPIRGETDKGSSE